MHAEDTAEGDDVTCILEKERERLLQQVQNLAPLLAVSEMTYKNTVYYLSKY